MEEENKVRQYFSQLLRTHNIAVPPGRKEVFETFVHDEQNRASISLILQSQNSLMAKWKLLDRIAQIAQQPVRILNATVGKPYEALLDFEKLHWNDLIEYSFEGLVGIGLSFDKERRLISGTPTQSGDQKLIFKFKVEGQEPEAPLNEKTIVLIVNHDPKSLWKTIESNREDPYFKEDNASVFAPLGGRHILVSSKRGRSHANVGSFREDDFAFTDLDGGWSLVVLADGAGSAKTSRKGSALACESVVDYFRQEETIRAMIEIDNLLIKYDEHNDELQKKIKLFVYNNLGKAVFQVHKALEQFAQQAGLALKDLSSTLIFTLFKKYDAGYAFLSFGVGDCPIAVLNKDLTEVHLMNWLDVGEFGGGTRFITMPEIFQNEKFYTRFGFQLLGDFSYLVMMTDGIYDPKFVVEANLPNVQNWQAFFADLNGNNDDKIKVELTEQNKEIEEQFSRWMDFWSAGNHDDRTLAIVF